MTKVLKFPRKSSALFYNIIKNLVAATSNAMHPRNIMKIGTTYYNDRFPKREVCNFLKIGATSFQSFIVYFIASIIMHSFGLYSLIKTEGGFLNIAKAIMGNGLEGVLIFQIIMALISGSWLRYLPGVISKKHYHRISIFLAISIVIFSVTVIISEYMFQTKTGTRPGMWIIIGGFKDPSSLFKAEISSNKADFMRVLLGILSVTFLAFIICLLQVTQERKHKLLPKKISSEYKYYRVKQNLLSLPIIFFLLVYLYRMNSCMPIFHSATAVFLSTFLSPPMSEIEYPRKKIEHPVNKGKYWPNVVVAMHESLSGEFMLTHESSLKKTPFFTKKMLKSDGEDSFYVFEHARTVSGDTTDCLTAIQSGCLPLDHKKHGGKEIALSTSLATEFKRRGFDTVSFTSRILSLRGTKWFMIEKQLSENFDEVFHPGNTKEPLANPPGIDDRTLKKYFSKWLKNRIASGNRRPFYAQFYYWNAHYPFLNDTTRNNETTSRVEGMINTVDKSIENIFEVLNETNQLNQTMVVGSGDHGEVFENNDDKYLRTVWWGKNDILRIPIYMYLPRNLLLNISNDTTTTAIKEKLKNLRYNTYQLVSILDIYPTIMHVLEGKGNTDNTLTTEKCVRGLDLFEQQIQPSRIAWSFSGTNQDFKNGDGQGMALHKGTASSLHIDPAPSKYSIVHYDAIPDGYSNHPKSIEEHKPLDISEWKTIIEELLETTDGTPSRQGGLGDLFLEKFSISKHI